MSFTSESVSPGHPDKIADQISDAILDAILTQDKQAHVACETLVTTGTVLIGGEITTTAWIDLESITRETIKSIGYTDPQLGFHWKTCGILSAIGKQSPDIALGVNQKKPELQGAGDQGIVFGYATNETESYIPAPLFYAHRLMQAQHLAYQNKYNNKNNKLAWLRPDAKCQITFNYKNNLPNLIDTVIFSTQHDEDIHHADLAQTILEELIKPNLPEHYLTKNTRYLINPTGRYVIGGPVSDCGMTGRKIIVDSYGGMGRHGGGAFSGKDPSKIDRSAAYMARYLAKNIVAAGLATQCEIQLAYAIGIAEPISFVVNINNNFNNNLEIKEFILKKFDLTPYGIIKFLDLLQPIYFKTAAYGHFGRTDCLFSWEKIDPDFLKI